MIRKEPTAYLALNEEDKKVIQMVFPYDLDTIFKVRSIPGRKFHGEEDCWSAPLTQVTVDKLRSWGFTIDGQIDTHFEKKHFRENKIVQEGIPGLKGELYPFQKRGVAFIEENKGRALIADEMGLGKTIQAIAWLQLHPEKRPAIVVTPASLKLNWIKEILTWMKKPNPELLMGLNPWKPTGEIMVINYDVLWAWRTVLKKINAEVIITDECHYFKSNRARRTKAVKSISKKIPCFIGLSGTPIENRPIEIYNVWHAIDPENCPLKDEFEVRFCDRKFTSFGKDVGGHSNENELHSLLTNIMLRRLKADVLPDLPSKTFSHVPLQLCNVKEYRGAEADFISFIKNTKGEEAAERASNAKAFAEVEGLKQLCVKGKMNEMIQWIKDFLEVEDKLVVFAIHKVVINALMEVFGDIAVKIDGSVSIQNREKAKDRFQTDPKIKLFVGQMKAAGEGITLTRAYNVAILELPWSPKTLDQCIDRCHRIGQKFAVNIYYLLAMNTIEEKIVHLLDKKRKVIDATVDGKVTEYSSLINSIINEYKKLK